MYAIHILHPDVQPPSEPAAITPLEIARALFDASERIVVARSHDRRAEAIEANTALWLGLSSAARENLVALPETVCGRLYRIAETVARRSLTATPADIANGGLAMRLVRLNDLACRALAPPTPRRRPTVPPPPGLH